MQTLLRQILGSLLCVIGLAVMVLALALYERYSRFEQLGVLPPIATWELAGFLWLGKWPIVSLFATIGILLVVASPAESHSDMDAGPSPSATAIPENAMGLKTPFAESWMATTSRSEPGPGGLLGS